MSQTAGQPTANGPAGEGAASNGPVDDRKADATPDRPAGEGGVGATSNGSAGGGKAGAATSGRRRGVDTRAGILVAARERFAADGYERATIRAIAADASIDPAMVMRYFGNKEKLFAAAAEFDLRLPDLSKLPREEIGAALTNHFLDRWEDDESLKALLRASVTNEAAADRMRQLFVDQLTPLLLSLANPANSQPNPANSLATPAHSQPNPASSLANPAHSQPNPANSLATSADSLANPASTAPVTPTVHPTPATTAADPVNAATRAGLVATQALGFALCRYVLALPPVAALTREEAVAWLGPTITRYLTATPTTI
jgi:AcrR family transcriptional regulator